MKAEETPLKGVLVIKPDVYGDTRGYFFESYKMADYKKLGIPSEFVQDNISRSIKETVRGLHYQIGAFAQGKLCQVIYGEVLDVVVDIRKNSTTYGQHFSFLLTEDEHTQIWIPPGFAHGFSVLTDFAIFHYKCTQYYNKESERSIYYADSDLNIDWKVENPLVSDKDKSARLFNDIGTDVF
jgi:dTDP-4-dehydrorhamnose 3,5-epimerase